jgi:hypothetical protein
MELFVTHIISFRRPEQPYVLSRMSVPPGSDAEAQVHRLEDLGYKVVDVSPPLSGYGPPQNPHPRTPALHASGEAEPSFRNRAE